MKSVALKAFPRTRIKRTAVKKLRQSGRVPAVIYGRHNPPQNLELALPDIEEVIHHSASENVLVDLAVEGDSHPKRLALVQAVQHHPLTGDVLHVDLHEVIESEKVTVTVPLETVGEAVGVKTGGGVLEHVLFNLKVRALPKDLPESIAIDVSSLEIGQSIHLGQVAPPPGVEIIGDKKIVVLSVAASTVEAAPPTEAEAEAAAAPTEPEMIKEKKPAAEEAAAAPAAPAPAAKKKEKEKEK